MRTLPAFRTREDYADVPRTRAMSASITKREDGARVMSFSSESEIELWPGTFEILSHDPGACDMSRLQNGGMLLFNHDRGFQLGRLDSCSIDADKMGRCAVTEAMRSQTTQAQEVWKDIDSGVLSNTSVGYKPLAYVKEEREDGTTLYRVTKWQPSEVSIVTIPADLSTGVDRADNTTNTAEMNKNNRYQRRFLEPDTGANATTGTAGQGTQAAPVVGTVTIERERQSGVDQERQRMQSIAKLCTDYGAPEIMNRALTDGLNSDQVRDLLLKKLNESNQNVRQAVSPIGLTSREAREFSFVKLIRSRLDPNNRALNEDAKFELEVCEAARYSSKRSVKGLLIPSDVLLAESGRMRADPVPFSIAGGGVGTGTGGNVVATTLMAGSFIEALRNKCRLMAISTNLAGLVGNINIPRQVGLLEADWVGENDIAPGTQFDFEVLPLSPHTLAARSIVTREMILQPALGVEALVRGELINAFARKIDKSGFYATGGTNQPKGLKFTTGLRAVQFADTYPTYTELVAMKVKIAKANVDTDTLVYVSNAEFEGYAETNLKFPTAVNGGVVSGLAQAGLILENGKINGKAFLSTNQVTDGDVWAGDFSQFLVGMLSGLDLMVDPYTLSDRGAVRLNGFQDFDLNVRHPEAICYGSKTAAANG